jgi:hypothetical protein
MADKEQNILKQFQSLFSFKVDNNKVKTLKKDFTSSGQKVTTSELENFPSYVKQLHSQWLQSSAANYAFEDRKNMYSEMDNMFEINPLMVFAKDLLVNEIIQSDTNNQIIKVEAKDKKQQKRLEETLIRLNIDSNLQPMYTNLIKYGDAGWMNTFYEKGVAEILNVDPYDIDDRIEFTPHDVEKELRSAGFNSMFRNLSNDQKMKILIKNIVSGDDYTSFFRSYLFGFQLGSFVVPPWRFSHFRNYETNTYFAPFGTPAYIHSLAPVKMYDMALGLAILARQVKMPVELYKLKFPMGGMPTDKIELATQFMRAWQASGINATRKENNGMGTSQITIEDLFEWEQKVADLDLDQIGDLELLDEQVRKATQLPRNFLDPDSGSFGNSGISLIQQFKPFARKCYKYQTIGLDEIAQILKIDLIQSGDYTLDEIDFKLSMPYPESQNNPDIASSQRDLFTLANEVLDGIKDKLDPGGEIKLPSDLIKQVYTKVTDFDPDSLSKWVDMFVAEREKAETESQNQSEPESEDSKPEFTFESIKKKISPKLMESIIQQETMKAKIGYATEHASGGRHYLSSRKVNPNFDIKLFEKTNSKSKQYLNEELRIKSESKFNSFKQKTKKVNQRMAESEKRRSRLKEELDSTFFKPEIDEEIDLDSLNEGE